MAAETLKADVNEILLGYHILGSTWNGFQKESEVKNQLTIRRSEIGDTDYNIQEERAKVMAIKSLDWARANNYGNRVVKAWWTARPGILSEAVGYEVDSSKNPTDTLVQFETDKFLGLSAKSTAGKGDIGFKNPGIGTIDKALSLDLAGIVKEENDDFAEIYGLSTTQSVRKREIRSDRNLIEASNDARNITLEIVRDVFYNKLNVLSNKKLKEYVLSDWLDATKTISPMYIKVTGHGSEYPYTASLMNPLQNSKIEALHKSNLTVSKVGNDSVGVETINKRILKMRVKYESQAMASSVKFSGDPWQ
jgi:hypothetical protein